MLLTNYFKTNELIIRYAKNRKQKTTTAINDLDKSIRSVTQCVQYRIRLDSELGLFMIAYI